MEAQKFRVMCNDPKRTRRDLENLRANARAKNRPDLEVIAAAALEERFPETKKPRGLGTPTRVRFRSEERVCETAKEAYVWLLERIFRDHPELLQAQDWRFSFIADGQKRHYFARRPEGLFDGSPHLADESDKYVQLSNGWFADINLSNSQKFGILAKVTEVAKLRFEVDWYWEVIE